MKSPSHQCEWQRARMIRLTEGFAVQKKEKVGHRQTHVSLIVYTSALCCRCWLNPKECNKIKTKIKITTNKQTNKNTTTNIFHLLCGFLKKRVSEPFYPFEFRPVLIQSTNLHITRNGNPHRPPAYEAPLTHVSTEIREQIDKNGAKDRVTKCQSKQKHTCQGGR